MRAIGADEKNLAPMTICKFHGFRFYVIETLLSAEGAPGAAREARSVLLQRALAGHPQESIHCHRNPALESLSRGQNRTPPRRPQRLALNAARNASAVSGTPVSNGVASDQKAAAKRLASTR